MLSKSKSEMFNKTNNSKNAKKSNLAESAILSMTDLDRIKKNATILSKEESENNKKILEDQKQFSQASAQVKILHLKIVINLQIKYFLKIP